MYFKRRAGIAAALTIAAMLVACAGKTSQTYVDRVARAIELPNAPYSDILIVAIGRPEFVTADFVKPGAIVVDVGIHRVPAPERKSGFRLKGDVKFDEVEPIAGMISPVPGGVGPMTIAGLLYNTLLACRMREV